MKKMSFRTPHQEPPGRDPTLKSGWTGLRIWPVSVSQCRRWAYFASSVPLGQSFHATLSTVTADARLCCISSMYRSSTYAVRLLRLRPCMAAILPSWSNTLVGTVVLMRAMIVVRPCVVTCSIPDQRAQKKPRGDGSPQGYEPGCCRKGRRTTTIQL
jgi:hypothetical protein